MIYTIERPERWNSLRVVNGKKWKPSGGMVFPTRVDADAYLTTVKPLLAASFKVYPVDADWDRDAQQTLDDQPWRVLTRSAEFVVEGPSDG
jgi:hypothetical protein